MRFRKVTLLVGVVAFLPRAPIRAQRLVELPPGVRVRVMTRDALSQPI